MLGLLLIILTSLTLFSKKYDLVFEEDEQESAKPCSDAEIPKVKKKDKKKKKKKKHKKHKKKSSSDDDSNQSSVSEKHSKVSIFVFLSIINLMKDFNEVLPLLILGYLLLHGVNKSKNTGKEENT